ncbi:MAG TPA: decarboxylating 6-phosphogluconate dehydrogenase [Candidatus Ozemobacteraceae bacterium]|nr:decarboxylating 6-phosphogluconate dehydrogenase [Candidatus Ozemobacteraceae bacterium]
MKIGFIGLGKMGLNMVRRLAAGGHEIRATARTTARRADAEAAGAHWEDDLDGFVRNLEAPRAVWVMVPAGAATEETIESLSRKLAPGDIIIDGGNSDHRDTVRRAERLTAQGLKFVDCGTSGGIWGLEKGYCLMIGGDPDSVARLAPVFTTLAPPDGWMHVGKSGFGHYVKMVHNAVEYGMMQAYAEGFELLQQHCGKSLNLGDVSRLWNRGSVVRSWLLELSEKVFDDPAGLDSIAGRVNDSGECRWAIESALAENIPAPVFAAALFSRFASRRDNGFGDRFLAALRNQFGGHAVTRREER